MSKKDVKINKISTTKQELEALLAKACGEKPKPSPKQG